jgi:Spy/CpxP family protein refolding chaperone
MLSRILLAGLLTAMLAFAQRGGGGGGGERGGDSIMPRMNFTGTRLDRLSDALKLSKDQKKDIKAAMDEAQKEATPLHEQLIKSRLAIAEAIAAGKSQEEIAKAVHSEAELETQMASIELHAFAKVVVLLQGGQKQQGIRLVFEMVRGVFNGKNWNSD